ncbi:MAG: MraY family glycosyltransferase, partial [Gemmatimonadota bacterium]
MNASAVQGGATELVWLYALAFGLALALALGLTYVVREVAWRLRLVDVPDDGRHRHGRVVPRIGGVAVYVAATAAAGLPLLWAWSHPGAGPEYAESFLPLFAGGAAMFGLGLWDDVRPLRAGTKFVVQCAVAAGVFAGGVRIDALTLPGAGSVELALPVSLALTCLWIVGITNAFNLIDGSDGVAGGAALFASLALAAVLGVSGDPVA